MPQSLNDTVALQSTLSERRGTLYRENYTKYIEYLHRLGTLLQESWQLGGRTQETGRKAFRRYVVEQVVANPNDKSLTLTELCECASNLEVILTVWEDPGLLRKEKAERQAHKVKRIIDIADRHAIRTALFAEVAHLVNRIAPLNDVNANAIGMKAEIQKIKQDFASLVASDDKLDNTALINILKCIKLLTNTEEKSEQVEYLHKFTQFLDTSKDNKKLKEFLDSVTKNEKRNEELLEEILDLARWRHNESLLEAILYRVNESKQANEKILKEISPRENPNKELLRKVADRIIKNKAHNEKLLSTIVDYLSKKEKQNESLKKEIETSLLKFYRMRFDLRFKPESSEYVFLSNEIDKLKDIIESITKDKKDNAELLRKIYCISDDKKKRERIKKLLGENFSTTENVFNAWDPTEETIQESQKLLAGIEAAVKSKQVKKVLTSFKTAADKALSRVSVFLSVLAGLSCGIVTGGCIFLLLIGATVGAPLGVAIVVGTIVFMAGFSVNFNFFSYAILEFLLKFAKSGGITEFIDQDGKRVQLSNRKKLLLVPAAVLSVAVGVCAFTI